MNFDIYYEVLFELYEHIMREGYCEPQVYYDSGKFLNISYVSKLYDSF